MPMRKAILIVCLIFLVSGCKKTIEKIKENAIISAMTDGQWIITSFVKNGAVITSDFSDYKFQYYSDRTVDAIKNGAVEKKGTWDGDPNAMTVSANFSNATLPLVLLNGIWHIDDSSWTYVVASQNSGAETMKMRLEKL